MHTIFINDQRHEFSGDFITGASVHALAGHPDCNVYFDVDGTPETLHRDWHIYPGPMSLRGIEVKGGEHFYTAPNGSYVSR